MKNKLSGSNLVILQSLLQSLNLANQKAMEIKAVIEETIPKMGKDLIGEQEGEGQYILTQEPDGSFFISWEKPVEPAKGKSNDPK